MAAAIRVAGPRICLAGVGPFGRQVTELIFASLPHSATVLIDDLESALGTWAGTAVVALWRPDPALCEQVDEAVVAAGASWLPIVMEHPRVHIGPYVESEAGTCFRCYRYRRWQHDPHTARTSALYAAYARDPGCGPAGFLPHHARVAAAAALDLLGRRRTGVVTSLSVFRPSLKNDNVVGRHGCDRCRTGHQQARDIRDLLHLGKVGYAGTS